MQNISNRQPAIIKAIVALVTAVALFHAAMLMLYNLPGSYISARYGDFIARYINPYFQQSWSLFAPSPGDFSTDVSFRYSTIRNGKYIYTNWIDGNSMFPRELALNPINRLALEREIYFSQTLIVSNDVKIVREFVKKHPTKDPGQALSLDVLPDFIAADERFFMAMEPYFTGRSDARYALQIAVREIPNTRFGKRFGLEPNERVARTNPVVVLPWIRGEAVPPFVDGVQVQ